MHASTLQVDVLVIGAGLAGTQAAYAAAQLGARVAITSSSHIFSGSSFSRSTYEMNVLKPPRDSEKDELIHTIEAVGQNVTDHELVKTMIDHIADAHENLKHQKLSLIHPRGEEAQTYIPSFDHRRRPWCKIEPKRYRHALERKFHELDIIENPICSSLILLNVDNAYLQRIYGTEISLRAVHQSICQKITLGLTHHKIRM